MENKSTVAHIEQLSLAARYQIREERVFTRDQLPAAYQTLFRSTVRFGYSIDNPQLRIPRGPVILYDLLQANKCLILQK